jgi:DNA gyrase subunit A
MNTINNIIISDYSTEMKTRYLDYAMSVIIGRALPDVRDGLKPVHRRIIYSMNELGIIPDKPYKKSARIVGDVLGKYHPHGDTSVYDAMVRMAQDFNLRYPLVDGHGNWGSIDGDSAAAYRYTEAKLSKITMEILKDIRKNTVDFVPNFDGEEEEPSVLTSRFPNLLANGSEGIAVGMATSIPSHNLNELIDGFIHLIDNPDLTIDEIMQYIKSPDFPTGANIINPNTIANMYKTGKGFVTLRSSYHIEKHDKIKSIVFTEIPYQTNKAKLIENIADFIKNKDEILKEIIGLRDESDKDGMRIVVDIKNKIDENKILARLFQKTRLQCNYNAIFCVIVNNQPKILNLKQIMEQYIIFQREVITKRTQFELDKAKDRLHILKGLLVALNKLDYTIQLIRQSKNKSDARATLIKELQIDEKQADVILELKLQRLTNLEIDSINKEYDTLLKQIDYLQSILNDKLKLDNVLKEELLEIKNKYGDNRRTKLIYEDIIPELTKQDMIEDNSVTIVLTKGQYIKKTLKYSETQKLKENDEILQMIQTSNAKDLLLFTNQGRVFTRKIYELTGVVECTAMGSYGEYIPNILKDYLNPDEKIIYITSPTTYDQGYMLYIFENNNIVKMAMKPYYNKQNRMTAQDAFSTESPLKYIKYIEDDIDILTLSSEGKTLIQNTIGINPKTSNGGKKSIGNPFMKLDDNINIIEAIFNPEKDAIIQFQTKKKDCIEINLSDIAQTSKNKISYFEHCRGKKNSTGNFVYNCRQKNDKIIKLL